MIEARNVSSACSLSLGVSSSCRRICDRSTPLESISGIGKGSWDSLERWLTKQSVACRSVGESRDEYRISLQKSGGYLLVLTAGRKFSNTQTSGELTGSVNGVNDPTAIEVHTKICCLAILNSRYWGSIHRRFSSTAA